MLERLQGYQRQIAEKMSGMGAEVVDAGMVDDPAKADAAARRLKENDVELVFLYISTYALSSTVLPVVQRLGVPVISCMGAGNKLDPTRFEVADLSKTSVCPLARVMRLELRRRGITHLKVVYSKEEPRTPLKA